MGHTNSIDEVDVHGIPAFEERILPRALRRLRVRIKEWLADAKRCLVSLDFASWNQLNKWLRQVERLRWCENADDGGGALDGDGAVGRERRLRNAEQRATTRMLGRFVFAAGHASGTGVAVVMQPAG